MIDEDMNRMAKDLPANTPVFCIGELYSGYPEFRRSSTGDHCYGCQPVILATRKIKGVALMMKDEAQTLITIMTFLDGDKIEQNALKRNK